MLRALRQHLLLVGIGEVLIDTIRYLAVMAVVVLLLAEAAKLIP